MKQRRSGIMMILALACVALMLSVSVVLTNEDSSAAYSRSYTYNESGGSSFSHTEDMPYRSSGGINRVESSNNVPSWVSISISNGRVTVSGTAPEYAGTYNFSCRVRYNGSTSTEYCDVSYTVNVSAAQKTIYFNGNGGTASTPSTTVGIGSYITLPSASLTNYNFNGWYTASAGGSRVGGAGDSYYVSGTTTLYAQWTVIQKTVTFNGNGGSPGQASSTVNIGTAISLPGATWANHTFLGWYTATSGGTYLGGAGASYTVNSDTTIYAQWKNNTLTVGAVSTQYAVVGQSVSFSVSAASDPSGASVTYYANNAASADVSGGSGGTMHVTVSGDTVTCTSNTVGTYSFTLKASASNYPDSTTTVTVQFAPVLQFTNAPAAGALNS